MAGGPAGLAIGAVAGAGAGLFTGLWQTFTGHSKAAKDAAAQERMNLANSAYNDELSSKNKAFSASLSLLPLHEQQKRIKARLEEVELGEGETSIPKIREILKGARKAGQTGTSEYNRWGAVLGSQVALSSQLKGQYLALELQRSLTPFSGGLLDPSRTADAYGQRGLSIGETADIPKANAQLLDELRKCVSFLSTLAGHADRSEALKTYIAEF